MRNIIIIMAGIVLLSSAACADDEEGRLVFRGTFSGLFPAESNETFNVAITRPDPLIDTSIGITADMSYFVFDRLSLTASAGWFGGANGGLSYSQIDPSTGAVTTTTSAGKLGLIPLSAIVQFHIAPYGEIRPYVGAGVHYTIATSSYDNIDYEAGAGLVGQVGADWWTGPSWGVNVDLRYYQMTVTGDYSQFVGFPLESEVNLNPLVASVGIAYRF